MSFVTRIKENNLILIFCTTKECATSKALNEQLITGVNVIALCQQKSACMLERTNGTDILIARKMSAAETIQHTYNY